MSSSLHRFIPLDLPSDPALSRAQKRFSSLLKKIDRQRAELQAWETKEAVFARGWARSRDSDGAVVQGEAVVPGLVEALAATFA